MTDKELLEYAAKAIGIILLSFSAGGKHEDFAYYKDGDDGSKNLTLWNPLEDDGDALRLAVKLKINIDWLKDEVECYVDNGNNFVDAFADTHNNYKRAIVECSAEIGKAMP